MNRKLRNLLQADLFSEPAAEPSPAPEQPPARKPRYTPKRQFVAPNTDKLPTGETRQELEQRRQRIHVKAYIRELGLNYRALVECRNSSGSNSAAHLLPRSPSSHTSSHSTSEKSTAASSGITAAWSWTKRRCSSEPIPGSTNPIAHLLIWEKHF